MATRRDVMLYAPENGTACRISRDMTLQLGHDMPWPNLNERQIWPWYTCTLIYSFGFQSCSYPVLVAILFFSSRPSKSPSPISANLSPHFRWALPCFFTVFTSPVNKKSRPLLTKYGNMHYSRTGKFSHTCYIGFAPPASLASIQIFLPHYCLECFSLPFVVHHKLI